LALGEVPNIAARIQGLAEPDTVVISADTHRLIQGYFDCETLGEHQLRGVAQPMAVYRVVQDTGVQSRLDVASQRGLTPLVGREQEVGLLLERWERAREGQGQVVLLSGEAGIGKSRLVQVLTDHVANEPHIRWECRSLPYFTNSVLYPIIDLIQRTLQWQQDDRADTKLGSLEQGLSQYRLPMEESVPLFASLLSLSVPEDRYAPLALSPLRQRQKTLEAIVAIMLELAERQPVLLILEDLHWTDPTTLELFDLLIDQTPAASIYLLLTCRPEYQPHWSHRSHVTEVTINRLSREQITHMAERVADAKRLPDDIVQQLVDKTDGVPLYVEEMTKSVLESGVLKETDGCYELTAPLSSLAIPATLQDSLMSRLDRLVTAKTVAQYASVIGRQFSYELLQVMSELEEATLQRELGRLVDAELLYQQGLPPQATYMFKHALIQDIAYQSLLRSTRQGYHQRIAEVLTEQFADTAQTHPELLAHHYTQAGRNEQAIDYWQRAGRYASERSAYREAQSHLKTGLYLLQSLPETLKRHQQELLLQTALGEVLLVLKGQAAPDVEVAYTRACTLCQILGDTQDVFPVLFGLWRFYVVRPNLSLARQLGADLLGLAKRWDDTPRYVMAHYALGFTCFFLGDLRLSHSHLEAGVTCDNPPQRHSSLLRAAHYPGVPCRAYTGIALCCRGYPDQALVRAHDALALATALAHPFSRGHALVLASMICQFRRKAQEVYDHAEAAVSLSIEQGFPLWLAIATTLRGYALTACDQREAGLAQMRQGLSAWRATGAEVLVPYILALLAEGYEQMGHMEEGLIVLREALSVVDKTGERWYEAELHRLKGHLLLQKSSDNATEAAWCFQQAMAIAQNQSAKSWELRAATSLARLWQRQGKGQAAYDLLAPVYGWFKEGFDTADLMDAKALLDAPSVLS
jgi:predicted ATPase